MDNTGEYSKPEVATTPHDWARIELDRIEKRALMVSETSPDNTSHQDALVKGLLETGHFLVANIITPPDSKEAKTRFQKRDESRFTEREKRGMNPTPLEKINPAVCLSELGVLLAEKNNPLSVPFKLAAARSVHEAENIHSQIDASSEDTQKIADKSASLIAKGGKITFPHVGRTGVLMEASLNPSSQDAFITYGNNARNVVKENDRILFLKGPEQVALGMIQPKK